MPGKGNLLDLSIYVVRHGKPVQFAVLASHPPQVLRQLCIYTYSSLPPYIVELFSECPLMLRFEHVA